MLIAAGRAHVDDAGLAVLVGFQAHDLGVTGDGVARVQRHAEATPCIAQVGDRVERNVGHGAAEHQVKGEHRVERRGLQTHGLRERIAGGECEAVAEQCRVHRHFTDANRALLRSDYEARSSDELPVLVRWFEGVEPPVAGFLIVILYSREQLAKEGTQTDAEWGVVGCMYTAEPEEIPMAPITMMRNALGVEEGGSGVPIDRESYRRSVEFWRNNANWRG